MLYSVLIKTSKYGEAPDMCMEVIFQRFQELFALHNFNYQIQEGQTST